MTAVTKGSAWRRARLRWGDRLRFGRAPRVLFAWLVFLRGCLSRRRRDRLNRWAESHRMAVGLGIFSPAGRWLRPWVGDPARSRIWLEERIGWDRYGVSGEGGTLKKSLVIRLPGGKSKGIVFVWFEYDLLTLLAARDLSALLDRYRVVFAGSWSPPCYQALWSFPHDYRHEFVALLSHPDDGERIRSLGFQATILPLYMSSWQDPGDFHPRPLAERDVDIVMVANWARFKRHWVLFDALRRIRRPDLKVVLIGQPDTCRTVDDVRQEARAFGVDGQVAFLDRLPVEQVWRWLERSRISLVFSRREGSCVAVAESLMAGTPVGLLAGAEIGSRAFIQPGTGRLLREGPDLGKEILEWWAQSDRCLAREWSQSHLSAAESLKQIRALVDPEGMASPGWLPFCCRGVLTYRELGEPTALEEELDYLRVSFSIGLPCRHRT